MAANVIAFPAEPLPEAPRAPLPPSQSAEEAAFNRPRFGLHLGGRSADAPSVDAPTADAPSTDGPATTLPTPRFYLGLPAQVGIAVSQFDLEISHYAARLRLLRLMTQKYSRSNLPA